MKRRRELFYYVVTCDPMLSWQKIGHGKWHWSRGWDPSDGQGASYHGCRRVLKFRNAVRIANGILDRFGPKYPDMYVEVQRIYRAWGGEPRKSRMCQVFTIRNKK
jgi:hypothetical protein